MIHINEGQAQLSGWGYSAEPEALFINKVPEPFMVGQTISAAATRDRGGTSLKFKDGTILHYHQGYGLFPPLTNVTVWTVPAEGTTVSNSLEYVEIHASYTTKKGKVIQAIPAKVPVAVPSFMRCIVPEEPLINEGSYRHTQASWTDRGEENGVPIRGYNSAFFHGKAYLAVYWADSHGNIIKITRAEETTGTNLLYQRPFVESYSAASGHSIYVGEKTTSATFTRYRSETDEGTELTLENANNKIGFRYRIGNITLSCETYVQMNPVVNWGLFNLPTSYAGEETVTLKIDQHTKVTYKDGQVIVGKYADSKRFYLPIWFRYKVIGGWWEHTDEDTITLKDGRSGSLNQYIFETYKDNNTLGKVQNRYYSCEGGEVEWSSTPPNP